MEAGTLLGPYRIDRKLGSGGMGRVYAATGPEGAVALKVVHPHVLEKADALERFRREVEIGRTVDHPNVVRTFGGGESGGHHFLAMEYVEGETLDALLRELERVPEELCRHIGREICKGLGAIHAAGAIHRDLKPENVLITPDHVVKIMDLGVARSTDDALRLSQSGAFVGSLHYAAPEQFTGGGKGMDGRVDLHALGLVLYELATGVRPYEADDLPQAVRRVLHEEPRRLGEVNPQLSAFFEEVVHCLLAKDRDERFATADELHAVLEAGEEGAWWHDRARALQLATRRPIRRVRIPRETAVYGRDGEIATLRALFEQAKAGTGGVVVIQGEAGIGKSRLVDELVGRLQLEGEDINFLFGGYPPGGAATAEGGFSSAYREQFGPEGSAAHLPENEVLVPSFDALLRGEGAPPGAQPLTKASLQTCFVRATQSLAAQRTTIVLIDDLHFAPEEGRALFASLAMAVPGHRVLLIGTARPGVAEVWIADLARLDHAHLLEVPRLGAKDLVELLRDAFRSEGLVEQLGVKIAAKSDGNPFFAFEIIRGLREGQFITQRDDGTWASTRVIEEVRIPSSVLDLVNARVADLSEEERDLLDVACCSGFEFDPVVVAEACGASRVPTLKRLAQIERRHRLVRSTGRRYVFDHHQVQEALYRALNEYLREEYHAALADAMEARAGARDREPDALDGAVAVDLCEHFLKGALGGRALRYLPRAHRQLVQSYLHGAAAELDERALAVTGLLHGAERVRTLLLLAEALEPIGTRARHEEAVREAVQLARGIGDAAMHASALRALGELLRLLARHEEARAVLEQAMQAATQCGDQAVLASATGSLAMVLYAQGRLDASRELLVRQRELDRELGDRRGEGVAVANLSLILWTQGRLPEARVEFERCLEIHRELEDLRGQSTAHGNLGNVAYGQGHVAEARAHWERYLALTREIGDRVGQANATVNLGNADRVEGRLCEALDRYLLGLELSVAVGNRAIEAIAHVNLGAVWIDLGDMERAREHLDRSVSLCREMNAPYPQGYGLLDLGRVAAALGDAPRARRAVEESLALRRSIGHADGVADSLIELSDLHRRSGDTDAARTAADEAQSLSRAQGRGPQVVLALAVLACLPGGDTETAVAELAAAGAAADSPRVRWLLFEATGDPAHLAAAKRLLDEALARVPVEHHDAMCRNLPANREILAACAAHGSAGAAD